jgi:drug/metabolite transporter (DMT)-like permease
MRVMDEESVALYNHVISTTGFVCLAAAGGDFARTVEVVGSPGVLFVIVSLGVLLAVSLPLYYVALRRMDVWKLRMFMLAAPVLIAVVEWPLWGVELSALQCLGAVIILAGLAALIQIERRLATDTNVDRVVREAVVGCQPASGESVPTGCACEPVQQQNKDEIE